jgi:predicted RNase H-like nuclease (RuvC/YqgF family)
LVAENQQLKENDALQDQKIQKQDQEIQELKKALEELKSRIK